MASCFRPDLTAIWLVFQTWSHSSVASCFRPDFTAVWLDVSDLIHSSVASCFRRDSCFTLDLTAVWLVVSDLIFQQDIILLFQSIAESLKKGKPYRLTHSRTPSNASSTSAEVAQLTAEGATTPATEATTPAATAAAPTSVAAASQDEGGVGEVSHTAGTEAQLTDVPLDRSEWMWKWQWWNTCHCEPFSPSGKLLGW